MRCGPCLCNCGLRRILVPQQILKSRVCGDCGANDGLCRVAFRKEPFPFFRLETIEVVKSSHRNSAGDVIEGGTMWETDRMRRTSLALEQLTYLNDKDGTIRVAPRRIFTPI